MKRRWIFISLIAVIAGAFLLSRQSASRLVPSIASAIESGLGRQVEIQGEAHFLPWRLGFTLANVVIHDDPRFGLEPMAYVDELQATVRLTALLRGRLEFDRLRLIDPSVNLAQSPNGWNFPALLDQALSSENGVAPPEVEVTGGRLNFRFGETKSVYYLWDASLTLEPGSRTGQLSIYFDGVPARTDRGVKGFGRLSARGTIDLPGDLAGDRKVNLQAALERSAASELLLLFQDRGSSVTGFFSGSAKLQGPLDALTIDGRLQLHEFERWAWLVGPGRGPAVDWGGTLNWNAQTLHLQTKPETLPVGIDIDGSHLLGAAEWQSRLAVRDTPAEALESLAREFGFALPGGTALAGNLNGEVRYATKQGLDGKIDFSGGTLSLAGKEMADVEPTALRFAGRGATLDPVIIRQGADVVRLEAGYRWADGLGAAGVPGLSWAFSGPELDLSRAREWGMALPGRVQSGKWRGNLRYEAATGGWRGEGDLLDAGLDVEGLAAKVHIDSARVRLEGAQFALSRMAGSIDGFGFRGGFQYDPTAAVQSQLQLQMDEIPLAVVPTWLAPALVRPNGVLMRTLGLANDRVPDWVESRRLNAQIQVKSVLLGDRTVIGPISARLAWSKGLVQITNLTGPGRLRGQGQVALAGDVTMSKVEVENLPWHGGLADATIEFDARQTQPRGTFLASARDILLIEGERWMHVLLQGQFEARGAALGARLTFDQIQIRPRPGDEAGMLRGSGQTLPDGLWEWNLDASGKKRRISGPVFDGFWK